MSPERGAVDRIKQLEDIENRGINPYPVEPPARSHLNNEINLSCDELNGSSVDVVGRIGSIRNHGKLVFFDIEDDSGSLQIALSADSDDGETLDFFKKDFATGDFVAVNGEVIRSRTGQPTVKVTGLNMLAKALTEIPQKLEDVETRSRQRYLDLLVNKEVAERFRFRSQMVQYMRQRFYEIDCIEVQTPVLDTTYGGAEAKPFVTHHNALNEDLYLRISNELYLKRLVIGGLNEGVFEFSTDFRNEGMDKTHNPEFTQVELYKAYTDYEFMMDMSENLMRDIANDILGTTQIEFNGNVIDLETPWRRLSVYDGLRQYAGIEPESISDGDLFSLARQHGIDTNDRGYALLELFEHFSEPHLVQPTFVIDYPESTSPLTKKHRTMQGLVERFECYVGGMEVMNCYSELNDPRKQRENFAEQLRKRYEESKDDAMQPDDDFIIAMQYGMPPMGGIGISIDRWAMIYTDAPHIREVITFPTMKKKE